eukprot:372910-Amphidinium_carterae.1
MAISAIVNLLADSGIVPSRRSEFALVRRRQTHIFSSSIMYTNFEPRPLCPKTRQNQRIPPKTDDLTPTNPSIGASLESTTPP